MLLQTKPGGLVGISRTHRSAYKDAIVGPHETTTPYETAHESAKRNKLAMNWRSAETLIRLHYTARGFGELEAERSARLLMPLLIPFGTKRVDWTTESQERINRTIADLARRLDQLCDKLATATYLLLTSRSGHDGKKRPQPQRLGLEGVRGPTKQDDCIFARSSVVAVIGRVKTVIGSMGTMERVAIRHLEERGFTILPPSWLLKEMQQAEELCSAQNLCLINEIREELGIKAQPQVA